MSKKMTNNDSNLENAEKRDKSSRLMFAVIAVLVVLIVGLCIYIFVFKNSTPSTNDESSVPLNEVSKPSEESVDSTSLSEDESNVSDIEVSEPASSEASEPISGENVSYKCSSCHNEGELFGDTSNLHCESCGKLLIADEIVIVHQDESQAPAPEHGWVVNYLGYTYLYYGIGMEEFAPKDTIIPLYAESVNNLKKLCTSSSFYHILVPTRCEFVDIPSSERKQDNFYYRSQSKYINDVFSKTDDGITDIDLFEAFKEKYNANEYIYYNTDPNYTHLGAYTAYAEYCKAAGITPISQDIYTNKMLENDFYGKFYTATGSEQLYENADSLFYYDIDEVYKSTLQIYGKSGIIKKEGVIYFDVPSYGYYCFLSDEVGRMDIKSQTKTGNNLLVIGDSSAAPFVTFMVAHYDNITYINDDFYDESISSIIEKGDFDDVIVIHYNTTASRTVYENLNILAGVSSGATTDGSK